MQCFFKTPYHDILVIIINYLWSIIVNCLVLIKSLNLIQTVGEILIPNIKTISYSSLVKMPRKPDFKCYSFVIKNNGAIQPFKTTIAVENLTISAHTYDFQCSNYQ